ncbi:MAG: class I SAM-dependent methyltransferase [Reichenbachiella sp.]|uniref:class I SAM-dependent methyltransferase n=1 Tax=Reichenbachiella sp. TaxID=2184521 RepID=UPI0032664CCE
MNLKKLVMRLWEKDTSRKLSWINQYLSRRDRILDIGCGPCFLVSALLNKGFEVTPIDVQNLSAYQQIKPIIYNGRDLPFEKDSYDVALLLTVLHHIRDVRATIREAKRVSKKIIIIEDVYHSRFNKYLIYFFDSLVNLEFMDHPHNNLNDHGWKRLFKEENLTLEDTKYHKIAFFCTQATYYLTVD